MPWVKCLCPCHNFISHEQCFPHQGKQICDKFSMTGNWYVWRQIQHHFHEDFPELDFVGGLSEEWVELVEESEYCPLSSGDVFGISSSWSNGRSTPRTFNSGFSFNRKAVTKALFPTFGKLLIRKHFKFLEKNSYLYRCLIVLKDSNDTICADQEHFFRRGGGFEAYFG